MLEALEFEWIIVEIILNAFQTCILRQTNNKMSTSQYLWPTLTPHFYNFYQTKAKGYFALEYCPRSELSQVIPLGTSFQVIGDYSQGVDRLPLRPHKLEHQRVLCAEYM
ncbi:hypothetical protein I308_106465 [Cryptococcus tetragattii IND107]|uniref:Uncharacterized protein n=1 Tax=Cryptococcus tetragattii IND107 TaxID=1296105 RepID=A0ABR3BJ05_9TREE